MCFRYTPVYSSPVYTPKLDWESSPINANNGELPPNTVGVIVGLGVMVGVLVDVDVMLAVRVEVGEGVWVEVEVNAAVTVGTVEVDVSGGVFKLQPASSSPLRNNIIEHTFKVITLMSGYSAMILSKFTAKYPIP
jgi:hypothetical protein